MPGFPPPSNIGPQRSRESVFLFSTPSTLSSSFPQTFSKRSPLKGNDLFGRRNRQRECGAGFLPPWEPFLPSLPSDGKAVAEEFFPNIYKIFLSSFSVTRHHSPPFGAGGRVLFCSTSLFSLLTGPDPQRKGKMRPFFSPFSSRDLSTAVAAALILPPYSTLFFRVHGRNTPFYSESSDGFLFFCTSLTPASL